MVRISTFEGSIHMNFKIRYSTIFKMLDIFKSLKKGNDISSDIYELMEHEDYQVELARYKGRVSKNEFIDYIINIQKITEDEITNEDLRIHHEYYKDLLDNFEYYYKKAKELNRFTPELFEQQIQVALKGLPDDMNLLELNFIFTFGIGQSFGWVYENNLHFDFLQLIKEKSLDDFFASISHEVHHVGMNILYKEIDLDNISLEELFYLYFSGEGLAVKYCNNAEGVLSKSIYDGPKNIGLDNYSWNYLNDDFNNCMNEFKNTIKSIKNNKIKTKEELEDIFTKYWMNPYTNEQDKKEIPKLKQYRVYSFGNDIWGIIHDCFGKDTVYETLKNPSRFTVVFNKALIQLNRQDLII